MKKKPTCRRLKRFLKNYEGGPALKCKNRHKQLKVSCKYCGPLTRSFTKTVATVRKQAKTEVPLSFRDRLRRQLASCKTVSKALSKDRRPLRRKETGKRLRGQAAPGGRTTRR